MSIRLSTARTRPVISSTQTNFAFIAPVLSTPSDSKIRFMDFCAGIGAGRLGLEKAGMKCVGFSEVDEQAITTYKRLFGETEINYGDLMTINPQLLPDFEMMIAGFPCQSFSVVGQRKGMDDPRGQVIYGLIKIMLAKNIKYFILENVKGLTNHDQGNTMSIILDELDKAGYKVFYKVLNSIDYGVPQMRERVYFVGIKKDLVDDDFAFSFPDPQPMPHVSKFLIDEKDLTFSKDHVPYATFKKYLGNKHNQDKHKIEDLLAEDLTVIDTRQSDLRVYKNRVPTLRTGRHGILYVKNGQFRKLSGYESLLLQGFPRSLAKKVDGVIPEAHLLKQTGNAMTVSTIEAISNQFLKKVENL